MADDHAAEMRDYLIVHSAIAAASDLNRSATTGTRRITTSSGASTGRSPTRTPSPGRSTKKLQWPAARLYSDTNLKAEDKERLTAIVDKYRLPMLVGHLSKPVYAFNRLIG